MEPKVGQEIQYDLLLSPSGLDRRKGLFLYHSGGSHVGTGYVQEIDGDHVLITVRSRTGRTRLPIGAIL